MVNPRLAFRTLARTPFVTLVTVLSLALGIGANSAIFSFFDQILLRPLPVPEPDRLVNLSAPGPKPGSQSCNQSGTCEEVFSYPMFRDLESRQNVLNGLAAHRTFGANLAYKGTTSSAQGSLVSGSYFPVLGLKPAAGRLLTPDDDRTIGAHFVAVLAYSYWETQHGLNPAIVGDLITINGQPYTVVGVAPRGFEGTTLGDRPRVFVPLTMRGQVSPGFNGWDNRRQYWAYVFGRLKDGVTIDQARAALNALYVPILNDVEAPLQTGLSDQMLARFKARQLVVTEGSRGQSSVHREATTPLVMLFSITGIVLLIACANVANLLVVRLEIRRRELAVRSAVGARRSDVVREALAEGAVLAGSGLVVALVVVLGSTRWLVGHAPPGIPRLEEVAVSVPVILFLGGLAALVAGALAVAPAAQIRRLAGAGLSALTEGSRSTTGGRGRHRVRSVLVTTQVALAVMLVVGAGLLLRGFARLQSMDPGIDPRGVLTFEWYLPYPRYDSLSRVWQFHAAVLERIRGLPGVTAAGASGELPLVSGFGCTVQGFEEPAVYSRIEAAGLTTCAGQAPTTPGYFEALRIPLLAGRYPTDGDNLAPERGAVVITRSFAERFWPGEDPIGKGVNPNGRTAPPFYHVVGVVGDLRGTALDEPPAIGIFYPLVAMPGGSRWYPGAMHVVVRTDRDDPLSLLPAVRRAIDEVDASIPIANAEAMSEVVHRSMGRTTFMMLVLVIAGSVALGLAAIGLYGLIASLVVRRATEIGVRVALGAAPRQIEGMVVRGALRLAVLGAMLGGLGALATARVLGSLLHGLPPWDPPTYAGAVALLVLVAGVAAWVPARRAARVDPVTVLREE